MIDFLPLLPAGTEYVVIPYYIWGLRYMGGIHAANEARTFHHHKLKTGDYITGLFCALFTAPIAGLVKIGHITGKRNIDLGAILLPDPRDRPSRGERRKERLRAKLKERDARIHELERAAGL